MSPAPALCLQLPTQTRPGQLQPLTLESGAAETLPRRRQVQQVCVQAPSWLEVTNPGTVKCG